MVAVSSRMLAVFAPQILLYGLAVVLYGILQAHRRFAAPALAPVLSSLVVIAAYVAFVPLGDGYRNHLAALPAARRADAVRGHHGGRGRAGADRARARAAAAAAAAARAAVPAGVARRVRGLAAVGIAALVAQDASVVAVIVLANGHDGQGALVLYNYGWQMFFVPYAVLAVPIATSAFPVLSAARRGPASTETAASSTRRGDAGLLARRGAAGRGGGARRPAVRRPPARRQPAGADLRRVRARAGRLRAGRVPVPGAVRRAAAAGLAAVALVAGWLLVIAADVAAVALVPPRWVVPVLGLGNTVGLTAGGPGPARRGPRHARARRAARRRPRRGWRGLAGAVAGAAVGAPCPPRCRSPDSSERRCRRARLRRRRGGVRGGRPGARRRRPARRLARLRERLPRVRPAADECHGWRGGRAAGVSPPSQRSRGRGFRG